MDLTFVVLSEAVTPQQVDAVRRGHVQVDVLQVEQEGEQQRPLQVLRLNHTGDASQTLFYSWNCMMSQRGDRCSTHLGEELKTLSCESC